MKRDRAIACGLLAVGSPILMFASTLHGSTTCQIDRQRNELVTTPRRSEAYPLILLTGIAQAVGAAYLLKGSSQQKSKNQKPLLAGDEALELPLQQQAELEELGNIATATTGETETLEIPFKRVPIQAVDRTQDGKLIERVKHILLEGETDSGKSTSSEYILSFLAGSTVVVDPHRKPGQWEGLPVIGGGRNYLQIAQFFIALEKLMNERYKLRDKGLDVGGVVNVLIDEYPAIAQSDDCKKIVPPVVKYLLREARKVGIRIILLSQGSEVKALGFEGEGSIRKCFTRIRLAKFALEHAKAIKNEALYNELKSLNYPYMIDDDFCVVPNLAGFKPTYRNEPLPAQLAKFFSVQTELQPWQKLESLYHLPPVEPSSPDFPGADPPPNSVRDESNSPNFPQDEESSNSSNSVEQFPNWA